MAVVHDPLPAQDDDTPVGKWCKNLDGIDRAVFFYYHIQGCTMSDIGRIIRLSESRVSQIFKSVTQRLRAFVQSPAYRSSC